MIISCFFLFHEDCYPGFSLFSCHDSFSLQCRHTIDHSSLRLRAAALSETLLRHLVQGSLSVGLPQGCSNRSPSFHGLRSCRFICLQLWRPEAKMEVSAGPLSLKPAKEDAPGLSPASPVPSSPWHSLPYRCKTLISTPVLTVRSPACLSLCLLIPLCVSVFPSPYEDTHH